MRVSFLVAGSADEPCTVIFEKQNKALRASCTSPAGERGLHCKHRLQILKGDANSISSGNEGELSTVRAWLKETELEEAYLEYQEAENGLEQAKSRFEKAKRKFAKCMNG